MSEPRFELRSEEVQEILSHIPNWIVRWGITVVFLTAVLLLAASWVIKYPDMVSARVTLTTRQPPLGVMARTAGTLKLLVKENQTVARGQYLAAIVGPDSMPDIFLFKSQMESFRRIVALPEEEGTADSSEPASLQVDYTGFLQGYFKGRYQSQANYQADRIKTVLAQIVYLKDINRRLAKQKNILSQEAGLAEKKYRNDKTLFSKNLISEEELAKSHAAFLQKRYSLEEAGKGIMDNKIELVEHQKAALELINQLTQWEDQHILRAPAAGTVSFFKFWSDGQPVAEGDEVMAVVPDSRDLVGKLLLAQAGAGKVKAGQRVNIKFDSYPYAEYGMVIGAVASVSQAAREGGYLVDVDLPRGLATSYGKKIAFKQGMQGTADIVTEDLRLLQRIFYRFKHLFKSAVG